LPAATVDFGEAMTAKGLKALVLATTSTICRVFLG
jgi:hypothetical protein